MGNTKPVGVAYSDPDLDSVNPTTLYIAGTAVTSTAAELNTNHGVTAGTTTASKTVVVDANKRIDALVLGTLSLGAGAGTAVTATAAELNVLHSATASTAEINTLADEIASVSQASTPATGTNATQFTFKNAAGSAVAGIRGMMMYLSNSAGAEVGAQTSLVVLTNGSLNAIVTGQLSFALSSAAGLLGVTLTAAAATYYLSFVLPNGKVITSTALVVN